MAKVIFDKVKKNFGKVEILRDVSLTIENGEFTVLLGSSGCGKTTLLRTLAGLETISGGAVYINERKVNNVHPRDRGIAMVFQNYALYPTMKVFDNIGLSLEVAKRPKAEIKKKVEEVAETLNLTDYLQRYPKELSGGQRQRVAMGRAMVRKAKVFLFDEPLSNLDAKLRAHMRVEIRLLHERLGATTIYVTHDQIEAMTMADKVVLMKAGKIIQQGTPDELYDKPNSIYVADFIGSPSMNFIKGKIKISNNKTVLTDVEGTSLALTLPTRKGKPYEKGQSIICGIRPADLKVNKSGEISGRILVEEKTGADNLLHFKVGETNFTAVVPRGTDTPADKNVTFSVEPEKLHLFDMTTEKRLSN